MKIPRKIIFITILFTAAMLSACSGRRFSATSWPGIAVSDDTAYVAFGQHVYAVNLENGRERWRYPDPADNKISFFSAPVLTEDGQLIIGGYDNVLRSLNPENGREIWSFEGAGNRYIGSPLITEDAIYAPSADQYLYVLDLEGGLIDTFQADRALWAKPSTDGQSIYLTSLDHHVYALTPGSLNLEWSRDLSGAIVGSALITEDGKLFVGTFNNEMVALDTSDGDVIWRTTTSGWVWDQPALADNRLYFGDLDGAFYALDAQDGSLIWDLDPDGPIVGTPLITEEGIFFTTEEGKLNFFDREGNPIWNETIGGATYTKPVVAGELILVAPIESETLLVALNANGTERWAFTPAQDE